MAAVKAMSIPTPTAIAVSSMCSMSRGWKTAFQLLKNQPEQNCPFWTTQLDAFPKVGITGPPPAARTSGRWVTGPARRWAPRGR
jgi:hypothetical protein